MIKHIKIIFSEDKDASFSIKRGIIQKVIKDNKTYFLDVETNDNIGSLFTVLTVRYGNRGFSFKPIEVNDFPFYYRFENVIIEDINQNYDFENIKKILKSQDSHQVSYLQALKETKGIASCPVILNVPLDIRSFEIGFRKDPIEEKQHMDLYDYVVPHYDYEFVSDKSLNLSSIKYRYLLGRGIGIKHEISRHLENNYLPILHANIKDDDLVYKLTTFCCNYNKEYDNCDGTDYLLADYHSAGKALSISQLKEIKQLKMDDDDPVLFMKIEIENKTSIPKIGFIRLPHINTSIMADFANKNQHFDASNGFGMIDDKVYLISNIEGMPCSNYEMAPLVLPKSKITINLILTHKPITIDKAKNLSPLQFETQKEKIYRYYFKLLKNKATIKTPIKQLNNYWMANYIQIRQNVFGKRNSDVYSPAIGVYNAIASESNPVIESMLCSGDFDYAIKCANYFFKKQRKNGFIQNMKGYMLETCGALIIANNVYNYTRNIEFIVKNKNGIIKAYKYIQNWIDINKKDINQKGFGLINGQVADPADNKKLYMLNAYAYNGLLGASNMLNVIKDKYSDIVKKTADELKNNILKALDETIINSPIVPISDGTFMPLLANAAEDNGASCLHIDNDICVTHGAMVGRDSLLSLAPLICFNVLDINDYRSKIIEKSINDVCLSHNTGFSQPYYNVLPYYNLRCGNIDSFVNEFYYGLTSTSDKETYYFWEHLFLATPHKTSEQSAFQIRLKEMLVFDDIDNNQEVILKGIPNDWKNKKDNTIIVNNMRTRLGTISYKYENKSKNNYEISVDFKPYDKNTKIKIYLPIRENEINENDYILVDFKTNIIKWKSKNK